MKTKKAPPKTKKAPPKTKKAPPKTNEMPERRYGWKPDLPDHRDLQFSSPTSDATLPRRLLDLPVNHPVVENQLTLGCCTGYGTEFIWRDAARRGGITPVTGSRLFIYWNERSAEGTVAEDSGAQIRTGMKVLAALGAPPESIWPYRTSRFATKPTRTVFAAAERRQSLRYKRVAATLLALKLALFQSLPVVFGFSVTESFESAQVARTGEAPTPKPNERVLGGHCVVIVGYDDDHVNLNLDGTPDGTRGAFLVRNSWGPEWGIHDPAHPEFRGHFWFSYQHMMMPGVADDFWVLMEVEDPNHPSVHAKPISEGKAA